MRTNILLLQKYFHSGSMPPVCNRYYPTWFHSNNPLAKSKGISITFHKSFHPEVLDSCIHVNGHFIFLKFKLNNFLFTVANAYAPNTDQACFHSSTLTRLSSYGGTCIIFGGYLNVALSPSADTSSGKSSMAASSLSHIRSLLYSHNLVDVWRIHHPTEKDYSYFSVAYNSYSRLNYFLISQSLLDTPLTASLGHAL